MSQSRDAASMLTVADTAPAEPDRREAVARALVSFVQQTETTNGMHRGGGFDAIDWRRRDEVIDAILALSPETTGPVASGEPAGYVWVAPDGAVIWPSTGDTEDEATRRAFSPRAPDAMALRRQEGWRCEPVFVGRAPASSPITGDAVAREPSNHTPCQWSGGNDSCYCRTCGAEYRYGREDRPACPMAGPSGAAGAVARPSWSERGRIWLYGDEASVRRFRTSNKLMGWIATFRDGRTFKADTLEEAKSYVENFVRVLAQPDQGAGPASGTREDQPPPPRAQPREG